MNDHLHPIFDVAAAEFQRKSREHLQDFNTEARDALRSIVRIAKMYPEALIPTPLALAIMAGAKVVGEE